MTVHCGAWEQQVRSEAEQACYALHTAVICQPDQSCPLNGALHAHRFEVRDVLSEELVLMRILNVLLAALQCPAAPLLSDRAVCTVVNTCFRVLHQSAAKGELLQRMAAHVMREMIRTIFARLPALAAAEAAAGALSPEAEDEEEDAEEAVEVAAGAPRPQGDRKGGAASHQDSGSAEVKKKAT